MTANEKLMKRVKALLAMAGDAGSPNEAAIAARMARSLMDKHQISVDDLVESDGFGEGEAGKARTKINKWENILATAVGIYNDCRIEITYDNTYKFQGFESDVEVAKFMFYYLAENGVRLSNDYVRDLDSVGNKNVPKRRFRVGYASELSHRLKGMMEERKKEIVESTGKGLVVVKGKLVEQRFGVSRIKQYKGMRDTTFEQRDAMSAGRRAGKNTSIHTGLGEDKKVRIGK